MAGDWEQLADDWKDHPVGMIGEIDCTTEEGLALCEDFEIQVRAKSNLKRRKFGTRRLGCFHAASIVSCLAHIYYRCF